MSTQVAGVGSVGLHPSEGLKNTKLKLIGGILSVVVPIFLWYLPTSLEPKAQHALAITTFMIICWLAEPIDHAIAGFIGCYLYWALGVAKVEVAFGGFANDTPWFLFGAMLIGAMASKTGLARRIAYLIMSDPGWVVSGIIMVLLGVTGFLVSGMFALTMPVRIGVGVGVTAAASVLGLARLVANLMTGIIGTQYAGILFSLMVTDFLLTMLVPSGIARVVITLSVAMGLLEVYKMGKGTNIGRGMFLVLTYEATVFDKMIIAGAASIVARGAIEKFGGVQVFWSKWFLAYLPCDVLTILAAWWFILKVYPPEQKELAGGKTFIKEELGRMGNWTGAEKRCLTLMLIALGLWLTDFWHHLSPSIVGFGVGLVATLPPIKLLTIEDAKKINFFPIFFVATAISMGNVLVSTNALKILTDVMFTWMTPVIHHTYFSTLILYWTAFVYHIFLASEPSMLGTSVPLLMQFAKTNSLDPLSVGMIWTFAAGGKILVYQNAVLIVGYSYGYFNARDILKMGFFLSIVQSLIILFLVPLYWPLIGIGIGH
jgi:sodium-dependent dicarboxylate transporter 2/3/5